MSTLGHAPSVVDLASSPPIEHLTDAASSLVDQFIPVSLPCHVSATTSVNSFIERGNKNGGILQPGRSIHPCKSPLPYLCTQFCMFLKEAMKMTGVPDRLAWRQLVRPIHPRESLLPYLCNQFCNCLGCFVVSVTVLSNLVDKFIFVSPSCHISAVKSLNAQMKQV